MNKNNPLWLRIYSLAKELHDLAPWNWMFETDVFGVKIPNTNRIYFVSIMGSGGEFSAVSAYRGPQALGQFNQLQDEQKMLPPETILTIPHIMLSFTDRENLSPEQLASIKSTGLKFHGTEKWPSLEETVPAYLPVLPEGTSLSDACIIIEQTLDVARRAAKDPGFLIQEYEEYDALLIRESTGKNSKTSWRNNYEPLDMDQVRITYKLKYLDESIKNVSLLPESRKTIQMDLVLLPSPIKEKGKKGYFPFALLMADKKTGFVTGMELLTPIPDLHTMYESVPQKVLDKLIKLEVRPQRIEVRSELLDELITSSLKMAGCRLLRVKNLQGIDEAVASLISNLESKNP